MSESANRYPELREGTRVESADHKPVGTVREVFRDLGTVESFGAKGIPPYQENHDPQQYAYSEAMPGAGDAYFTVDTDDGVLYIPFSGLQSATNAVATVAVDAEMIPDMNWKVRPDALAALTDDYPEDTGGEPQVA